MQYGAPTQLGIQPLSKECQWLKRGKQENENDAVVACSNQIGGLILQSKIHFGCMLWATDLFSSVVDFFYILYIMYQK